MGIINALLSCRCLFPAAAAGLAAALAAAQPAADPAPPIVVTPGSAVIVCPAGADDAVRDAAEELAKHLALVTGVEPRRAAAAEPGPDCYPFQVGLSPGDKTALAPEEARWAVTAEAAWFYGEARFAVYAFLEDALGIRWIEPGDAGIAYAPQPSLNLTPGRFRWAPSLKARGIRTGARLGHPPSLSARLKPFAEWLPTAEAHDQLARNRSTWNQRMRMGSHANLGYGHSFTDWWARYGEDHPEYFALNKYGRREPESQTANPENPAEPAGLGNENTVKLCMSQPGVAAQVIHNWMAGGRHSPWAGVCENDMGWGFCRCPLCRALDSEKDAARFGDYLTYDPFLTDRDVYLANAVARGIRRHDPAAGAVLYAYNQTELPPRAQTVDPNVLVGVVPTTVNLDKLERLFSGWRAAGARQLFLRPNYHVYYYTTALPMGFEKQMFDAFQIAVRHGAIAADYDSMQGIWPVTGIADYILAKAFSEPDRPFDHWETHYTDAFGPAAAAVKAYFRYWRESLWEQRLLPDLDALAERGKYYNFARGVMWSLDQYYTAADFDRTDALLEAASAAALSPSQRGLLEQLILANRHTRLVFEAVTAKGSDRFKPALALLAFRRRHREALRLPWLALFDREMYWGDITGIQTAIALQDYPLPWQATDLAWRFRLDPGNAGLAEGWAQLDWDRIRDWDSIRTDHIWEGQPENMPYPSPELRAQLKTYDGVAWYATRLAVPPEMEGRKLYLYFGAVDESCQVFVNGNLAGEHLFKKPDDWTTPFEIRIDPHFDSERDPQLVIVRVEDRTGAGGIWKRVWLVSRK